MNVNFFESTQKASISGGECVVVDVITVFVSRWCGPLDLLHSWPHGLGPVDAGRVGVGGSRAFEIVCSMHHSFE